MQKWQNGSLFTVEITLDNTGVVYGLTVGSLLATRLLQVQTFCERSAMKACWSSSTRQNVIFSSSVVVSGVSKDGLVLPKRTSDQVWYLFNIFGKVVCPPGSFKVTSSLCSSTILYIAYKLVQAVYENPFWYAFFLSMVTARRLRTKHLDLLGPPNTRRLQYGMCDINVSLCGNFIHEIGF